jgi:hypothetical protein
LEENNDELAVLRENVTGLADRYNRLEELTRLRRSKRRMIICLNPTPYQQVVDEWQLNNPGEGPLTIEEIKHTEQIFLELLFAQILGLSHRHKWNGVPLFKWHNQYRMRQKLEPASILARQAIKAVDPEVRFGEMESPEAS